MSADSILTSTDAEQNAGKISGQSGNLRTLDMSLSNQRRSLPHMASIQNREYQNQQSLPGLQGQPSHLSADQLHSFSGFNVPMLGDLPAVGSERRIDDSQRGGNRALVDSRDVSEKDGEESKKKSEKGIQQESQGDGKPNIVVVNDEVTKIGDGFYNNRGYEICGKMNQHNKPCMRIGTCPFHGKTLKRKKEPGKTYAVRKGAFKQGWTKDEHLLFLSGLQLHGKGAWREISLLVQTRTPTQIQSHAQKYFLRQKQANKNKRSIHDLTLEDLIESNKPNGNSLAVLTAHAAVKASMNNTSTQSSSSQFLPIPYVYSSYPSVESSQGHPNIGMVSQVGGSGDAYSVQHQNTGEMPEIHSENYSIVSVPQGQNVGIGRMGQVDGRGHEIQVMNSSGQEEHQSYTIPSQGEGAGQYSGALMYMNQNVYYEGDSSKSRGK